MNSHDANQEQDWPLDCSQSVRCQALDEAAHCSICRDFFNTPLSLLCGHSFCAECIRANIQFQERNSGRAVCPQCREPADSRQILANHALRDLVNNYLLARPQLISSTGLAFHGPGLQQQGFNGLQRKAVRQKGGKKQKVSHPDSGETFVIDLDTASEPEGSARKLRKRLNAPVYYPDPPTDPEGEAETDSEGGESSRSSSEPEKPQDKKSPSPTARKATPSKEAAGKLPRNWVQCPCCQRNFPMAIFNDHLDGCLESGGKADSPGRTEGKPIANGRATAKGKGGKPALVVPPKLLMAIEKDRTLRDRLKRYNLPTKGTRQELEQRYTRYRVEVQTALDRCESRATYESLARRVIARETSEVNAGVPMVSQRPALVKKNPSITGSDFDDLIKATRLRSGKQGKTANGQKSPSPEQDEKPDQQGCDRISPEEISAPGKENTWGRGFRRSSTGDRPAAQPPGQVVAPPINGPPLANGSSSGGGHSCENGRPPAEAGSGGILPSQGKQLPWSHGKPDAAAYDDVIEDSEDEENLQT